jgi:hypothetical protein
MGIKYTLCLIRGAHKIILVCLLSDYNAKANASPPRTANPPLRLLVAAAALLEVEAGPADVLELVVPVDFVVLAVLAVEDEEVVPLEVVVDVEGVPVLVVPVLDVEGGSEVDEVSVPTASPPVM